MNMRTKNNSAVFVAVIVIFALAFVFLSDSRTSAQPETYCKADSDCACGANVNTGDCFYGNKDFVDTAKQCPDFCSGVAGKLEIKCAGNECVQVQAR